MSCCNEGFLVTSSGSYACAASKASVLLHSGSDLPFRCIVQPKARRRKSLSLLMTPSLASGKFTALSMGQAKCREERRRLSILIPTLIGPPLHTVSIASCTLAVVGRSQAL